MKNKPACLLSLAFGIGALFPNSVRADHIDPFIEISCTPELDTFFLRTFHLINTPLKSDDETSSQIRKALGKRGTYALKDFAKANANCLLPSNEITFEVKQSEADAIGKCDVSEGLIDIKVNGKTVHTFSAFDGCHLARQITYSAAGKPSLLDCTYPEDPHLTGMKKGEMSCRRIEMPEPEPTPPETEQP